MSSTIPRIGSRESTIDLDSKPIGIEFPSRRDSLEVHKERSKKKSQSVEMPVEEAAPQVSATKEPVEHREKASKYATHLLIEHREKASEDATHLPAEHREKASKDAKHSPVEHTKKASEDATHFPAEHTKKASKDAKHLSVEHREKASKDVTQLPVLLPQTTNLQGQSNFYISVAQRQGHRRYSTHRNQDFTKAYDLRTPQMEFPTGSVRADAQQSSFLARSSPVKIASPNPQVVRQSLTQQQSQLRSIPVIQMQSVAQARGNQVSTNNEGPRDDVRIQRFAVGDQLQHQRLEANLRREMKPAKPKECSDQNGVLEFRLISKSLLAAVGLAFLLV